MTWRVMVEVTGEGGAVTQHVISEGKRTRAGQAATLGVSLAEGKATLAGLQHARCRFRRRCSHCGVARPLKDRPRRLVSLFGVVAVRAPRFGPSRCGAACRRSLTPVAEIMSDRCTSEYERVLAGLGSACHIDGRRRGWPNCRPWTWPRKWKRSADAHSRSAPALNGRRLSRRTRARRSRWRRSR